MQMVIHQILLQNADKINSSVREENRLFLFLPMALHCEPYRYIFVSATNMLLLFFLLHCPLSTDFQPSADNTVCKLIMDYRNKKQSTSSLVALN